MPLVTLSKILSSKALARTSQLYPSNSGDGGAEHTGSLTLKTSRRPSSSVSDLSKIRTSPKQEKAGSVRARDRASKSFTFSLDPFSVVASIRTRPKSRGGLSTITHPDSSLGSQTVSHTSHSVYSGYEDEDYGEPEVDAEEIRRPSGLGRRASLTDISTEIGEDVIKYSIDPESIKEIPPPVQSATEDEASRNSISDASDSESLVEIRYPSGLGNIKLILPPMEEQLPQSTYPHFESSVVDLSTRIEKEEARTPIPWEAPPTIPSPQSSSISLSTLLPILGLYLSPQSLASLALVDRAVGQEARALLWKYVNVSVTISSSQAKRLTVDSHTSSNILAAINTGKVGHQIKSLEVTCRLESAATRLSSNFTRSRPPPLILVPKTTTPLRSQKTLTAPSASTQSRTPPLPSKVIPDVQLSDVVVPTKTTDDSGEDDPVVLSKMRRASLMLRNSSLTIKNNVPDALRASAAKFRSTSLRLPRSLSLLRSSSSESIGTSALASASASPSRSQDLHPLFYVAPTSMAPVNGPSRTPEMEEMSTPEPHTIVTDANQDSSPVSAPLPSTGWTPPPEWHATPSLVSSPPSSLRNSVRSSLQIRPRPPSLSSLSHHSDLRLSPSLPSLRALNIPTPSWSVYHPSASEDAPPSPMTAAPSPVTPYSAISLSAFPLPPPSITPPSSVPPFRPEFSPLHSPVLDHSVDRSRSPSTKSVITPKKAGEDHVIESELESSFGLPKALATALERMVNLERVTIKYVSSGPMLNQVSYTRMRESIDLSLVKKANETLGMALPSLESLRCLRVVCQKGQEEVCRTQWEGVMTRTSSLKDLDLNVTSVQDLDAINS